jgi:hypothetical protein
VNVFSLVTSDADLESARLLIESLRSFGGALSGAPVHVIVRPWGNGGSEAAVVHRVADALIAAPCSATISVLSGIARIPRYPLASKVAACAEAERLLLAAFEREGPGGSKLGADSTLVWMVPQTLVTAPPALLDLESPKCASFRAVHISNVGSRADEPLDDYWSAVYAAAGVQEATFTVESLVDRANLRPYFNTHLFSVDARLGLMAEWRALFETLVGDDAFQSGPCADDRRRVFLHQAALCALLVKRLRRSEICELPPTYSYPLHFHAEVPAEQRAAHLGELVCPVYEGRFSPGETFRDIVLKEPLETWFADRS